MEKVNPSKCVKCIDFPCLDVNKDCYVVPSIEVDPAKIKAFMVSEAPPIEPNDYFYAKGDPFYMQTTAQAFKDAGFRVTSMEDVLDLGVYITTAIKCGKTGYSISSKTTENCSSLLESEMNRLPRIDAILLMGDTAIKSMNYIAKRNTGKRLIPSGSTYKIRKKEYFYNEVRVFPTYLQTGKSYLIEKSKRKMIAEDINTALKYQ
ncbi:MAG: uracil-DNA glycosylase [Candidatus Bathyarchaeota archaeon]|nr:uracil-DNA glycosylase [Candidatus Bathyarchaeota archaeon]MDH5746793.1 uracil-DNA glycosylase [Candidatus Bathyarchaeota archaeon]